MTATTFCRKAFGAAPDDHDAEALDEAIYHLYRSQRLLISIPEINNLKIFAMIADELVGCCSCSQVSQ